MGSLSIRAGDPNPKNFRISSDLSYKRQESRFKKVDGSFSPWTIGNGFVRDYSYEFFYGKVLDNYYARRNSGELLPQTMYLNGSVKTDASGADTGSIVFTENGNDRESQFRWQDGSSVPIYPYGLHPTTSEFTLLENFIASQGINPRIYPQAAAAKLYGDGWDVGTFLAEIHKTVAMFRNVASDFINLMGTYSEGRYTEPFQAWLAGRYGWRILIFDIQDINKLLSGLNDPERTRSAQKTGQSFSRTDTVQSVWQAGFWEVTTNDQTIYNLSVRGSVVADFVPSKIILNPVTTAWELVSYSFVIDWILNVGAALNALSFLTVNPLYTASYGYHLDIERNVSCTTSARNGATLISSTYDNFLYKERMTFKERHPCYVSPFPQVSLDLSTLKVIDLIALLTTAISRLTRR